MTSPLEKFWKDFASQEHAPRAALASERLNLCHDQTLNRRAAEREAGLRCRSLVFQALGSATHPVSSTHTWNDQGGWALAIGCVSTDTIRGIGVDLEPTDRRVEPAVLKRIASPEELRLAPALLTGIDFWTVKEACFKANPDSVGTVAMQYQLFSFDPATGTGRARLQHIEFKYKLARLSDATGDWTAAFALS